MLDLTDIINQNDLADMYTTFYPNTKEHTFFSAAQGTFSKIDHVLGHKGRHKWYKKTEIAPCILSDHHRLQLAINNNRDNRKFSSSWRLKNSLVNEKCVKTEIRKENKDFLELNKNENTTWPNLWETMKTGPRGKIIALSNYIKKLEKSHMNNLTAHLKTLEQTKEITPKRIRRQK